MATLIKTLLDMIYTIIILVLGIYTEKRYSPRLSRKNNGNKTDIIFYYTAKKGYRNQKILFTL